MFAASCRKQHKEEVEKLQQQLKSASAAVKAAEAERAKDLEKTRWVSLSVNASIFRTCMDGHTNEKSSNDSGGGDWIGFSSLNLRSMP